MELPKYWKYKNVPNVPGPSESKIIAGWAWWGHTKITRKSKDLVIPWFLWLWPLLNTDCPEMLNAWLENVDKIKNIYGGNLCPWLADDLLNMPIEDLYMASPTPGPELCCAALQKRSRVTKTFTRNGNFYALHIRVETLLQQQFEELLIDRVESRMDHTMSHWNVYSLTLGERLRVTNSSRVALQTLWPIRPTILWHALSCGAGMSSLWERRRTCVHSLIVG